MKNIPKICHLFWDGAPMSKYNVLTVKSFHKQNPDWQIIVYLSKQKYTDLGTNNFVPVYTGDDFFYLVQELPYIEIKEINLLDYGVNLDVPSCSGSDIFRMQILYQYGGVYSDFDVLWLKPMKHIHSIDCIGNSRDFEATVCLYNQVEGFHNVSIMIAKKGSQYIKRVIQAQETVQPPYEHQSYGSVLLNNTFTIYEETKRKYPRLLFLKYETFYPYSIFNMRKLYKTIDLSLITKDTLALHWFTGHERSIEFIKNEQFCSMAQIINDLGVL